ncbi:pyridoxal phosphate-dependent aminotransferase family protein [uncultured Flavobacterium sp.]|uniref:aminotransferase class I/II-fold pyridoxal phosphate-dependent enzyme n=1 Tax=uncultured Flavobacterium sp. TaxID=165435 RepID=UPI0025D29471|nr:pyridoxal phosphate-dependent aminotransferase family protein [uncultured Flavobacterium sp.]
MQQLPKSLIEKLEQRTQNDALRQLPEQSTLIDFASNDYLGLSKNNTIFDAAHQYLINQGNQTNGATGSRLISGNHNLYQEVENYIATFHDSKGALIFNSGYDANVGFFSAVPQKGDIVLYDEFIHASIRDGLRMSNAKPYKFPHNDLGALKKLIERHKSNATEVYIVTESVFSMDGDSPDLIALTKLATSYNCNLVVDEAHALGIFGKEGEGLVQHLGLQNEIFARIVTFGKGLGCHGAAILGSPQLKEYLVNFARSFIYTTGLPPHALATIYFAYRQVQTDKENRKKLNDTITFFLSETKRLKLTTFIESDSTIHCAILSGNEKVKNIALQLQNKGYNVKAILSPTVPKGQERLRFCLHSYNTPLEISGVLNTLKKAISL